MAKKTTPFDTLRRAALTYPEAHEDFPWGETAIKVRGKMFLLMHRGEDRFGATMKLPASRYFALEYPFAKPTGYGLGRSGWISATFEAGEPPAMDVLLAWLDESYRAVAPKKLVATLPLKK